MQIKLEMKLLEMGKDMKTKHSVSSQTNYGALHGGTNFSGQIYRGLFFMGSNDEIM